MKVSRNTKLISCKPSHDDKWEMGMTVKYVSIFAHQLCGVLKKCSVIFIVGLLICLHGFCQLFVKIGHPLEEAEIITPSNMKFTVLIKERIASVAIIISHSVRSNHPHDTSVPPLDAVVSTATSPSSP